MAPYCLRYGEELCAYSDGLSEPVSSNAESRLMVELGLFQDATVFLCDRLSSFWCTGLHSISCSLAEREGSMSEIL